jgi:WXXGXW repeat (2 copies)
MKTNMMKRHFFKSLAAFACGGLMMGAGISTAQEQEDPQGAEVLTRGPVHEAFAGTVSYDPIAGITVTGRPPEVIDELPPDQRPEGENVTWIPGYWAWDEDQNDFLWISGIWRNLPPGREWVPGYWAEQGDQFQWTSGYWEDAETSEVSYLPEPPRSVESGPNIEASSDDQTWIPGNWVYRENNYAWRAGYWVDARPNWSWTPSYYRWTHRGYVYVNGYWDYPVARRGVVFAPVRFQRDYIARPNFHYSPLTVISLAVFTNHLFLRPSHNHYYFGDYYEPRYRDRGYFASYAYHSGRRGYDPIYAHAHWEHRHDKNWGRQRQEYFEYRRDHQDARPPRTWRELNSRPQADRDRGDFGVADRYDRVVANRGEGRQRFQAVDAKERERYVSQRQEIRKFGRERQEIETRGGRVSGGAAKKDDDSNKVKINRSPVVSRKSDRSEKDGGPPARLQPRSADKAGNGQSASRPGNAGADKNQKANPNREGQARPKGKTEPATETRTKPGQKRDTAANPERKASPERKAQREARQQRQQANPKPAEPKAKPAPKREAEPQQRKKAQNEGDSAAAPKRQARPQNAAQNPRKQTANPQPQQAKPRAEAKKKTQPGSQPQRSFNNQNKAKTTPKPAAETTDKAERRKKRQEAE